MGDLSQAWLREFYPAAHILILNSCAEFLLPHNDAADNVHRQFVGWVCEHLFGVEIDAVFTSEEYGDGFAAALSEYFMTRGRAVSEPVDHVMVDQARMRIPTSGTAIRRDPHTLRAFLDPRVYGSYVKRVAVLGGESSCKTTLCAALATQFATCWVPEYGRERWTSKKGELEYADMLHIGQVQRARESEFAQRADRWLFCDTTPLTNLFYSLEMYGRAADELTELAQSRYDIVVLCAPDIPFIQDGTRRDTDFRCRQHKWYQDRLQQKQIPYTVLAGSLQARLAQATSLLISTSS